MIGSFAYAAALWAANQVHDLKDAATRPAPTRPYRTNYETPDDLDWLPVFRFTADYRMVCTDCGAAINIGDPVTAHGVYSSEPGIRDRRRIQCATCDQAGT